MAPLASDRRTPAEPSWPLTRFFDALGRLGRLRVIHQAGPSTFEALCEFGPYEFGAGHLNAITDAYHWHLRLTGLRHVRSHDRVHARSGRRVLFFELRESELVAPFCSIYLHREKGAEFEPDRVAQFAAMHAELAEGCVLDQEELRKDQETR